MDNASVGMQYAKLSICTQFHWLMPGEWSFVLNKHKMDIEKAAFGLIPKASGTGKTDPNGSLTARITTPTNSGMKAGTGGQRSGRRR
ncbi:hypothetical protein [Rufibacter sp. XAAS-G3-1]|uniref:hypothetical protein n=1 Tax=Rufibacter sp. XAAS-G3-1 TaxID=2729134 RepID=UPI00351AA76B